MPYGDRQSTFVKVERISRKPADIVQNGVKPVERLTGTLNMPSDHLQYGDARPYSMPHSVDAHGFETRGQDVDDGQCQNVRAGADREKQVVAARRIQNVARE